MSLNTPDTLDVLATDDVSIYCLNFGSIILGRLLTFSFRSFCFLLPALLSTFRFCLFASLSLFSLLSSCLVFVLCSSRFALQ